MKIRQDPEWAAEVQQGLSWLFAERHTTLLDSTYREDSLGARIAVINAGNIILRVSRDVTLPPEYIGARIAPVHAPAEFNPPLSACMALALMVDGKIPPTPPYKDFGTLQGLSKLLQQNFIQLNEAFSLANYPTTRQRMGEVKAEHWRQWEQKRSQK
jgi:hypothetical protein